MRFAIAASSDRRRAAYVALIVDGAAKPRLIFGTGRGISTSTVEHWAVNRALRRVNARYDGQRPIVVLTDNLSIVETRGNARVQYQWLGRQNLLIRHLHDAANSLRLSLPI